MAEAMLDALLTKVQRRETVYPGELAQVCRGLHVLAKCGAELGRLTGQGRRGVELSEAGLERLAARLRPLVARQAA